jgi:hypothetical protein
MKMKMSGESEGMEKETQSVFKVINTDICQIEFKIDGLG